MEFRDIVIGEIRLYSVLYFIFNIVVNSKIAPPIFYLLPCSGTAPAPLTNPGGKYVTLWYHAA